MSDQCSCITDVNCSANSSYRACGFCCSTEGLLVTLKGLACLKYTIARVKKECTPFATAVHARFFCFSVCPCLSVFVPARGLGCQFCCQLACSHGRLLSF